MKVKFHMWCVALLFALSTFAIPGIAQAYCGSCAYGGGGIIYNQNDGKWYQVPTSNRHNVIYRAVDDKYVPVAKYGCCHRMMYKHHHRYVCYHRVSVACQTRPTHWFNGHWYPDSCECFYTRVR